MQVTLAHFRSSDWVAHRLLSLHAFRLIQKKTKNKTCTCSNHDTSMSSWEDKKQETSATRDITDCDRKAPSRGRTLWWSREVTITSSWTLLFSKKFPPEISSISFRDPEAVPLEVSSREDGFDFSQHVAKDQWELSQVPSAEGRKERAR